MYTPEGYASWEETKDAAFEWTQDIVTATIDPSLSTKLSNTNRHLFNSFLCQKLVDLEYVENISEANFAMGVLELWVLANYMDIFDAVLCSPSGIPMRCPPALKSHGDAFDWWTWPISTPKTFGPEAANYFQYFRSGDFKIEDAHARFCAIDYKTGSVQLKANTLRLLFTSSFGHGMSPEDHEDFMLKQIKPFVGWSLCWNRDEELSTRQELYEALGFADLDWQSFNQGPDVKATQLPAMSNVLECVLKAYPDGKLGDTWKTIEQKVGYSRRSVVRALKKSSKYDDWVGGGRNN